MKSIYNKNPCKKDPNLLDKTKIRSKTLNSDQNSMRYN